MACLVNLIDSLRKALFKQINVNTMTIHDEECSAWNCSFVDWDSLCDSHRITPDRDNNLTLCSIVPCWPHPNNRDTRGNQGCCKVILPLSCQGSECFIEMIGEIASGVSDIPFSLSSKESKNNIVEDGQHFWRVAHAQLGMILLHGHISPMMQPILNPPMPSGQFEKPFGICQIRR